MAIITKHSETTGVVPTAAQLELGELAINTADSKLFAENTSGQVIELGYRDARVKDYLSGGTYNANIIPATNNTYDLGSTTKMWRDVYIGPGSLYVNGQKVIQEETASGDIIITADADQNVRLSTLGSGDIQFDPLGTGSIIIKGPLQIQAGNNISSSDGNAIAFSNQIAIDSLTSKTTNTDITITANGTGSVRVDDNLVITGNLTVSGTTTTINTETISLADNIIDLNSNFTTGTPTENAGIRIMRGDSSNVSIRWNEATDKWEFTNDGTTYVEIPTSSGASLSSFSVTDSGGDGSLSYNNSTGVFTYTGPSSTEVRSHFTAGTGITITSGSIATTITQYTDALARASLSGSTGISYNSSTGAISIDSTVATLTGTETFTNKTITAATFPGTSTFEEITEVINTKTGATGTVAHDYATGAIFYHSSISANFTANFTNVPTTNNRTIGLSLILSQGATPYYCNAVQVDGSGVTIKWPGAAAPTPVANRLEIQNILLVRVGSAWSAVSSLSSYG